MSNENPNNAPGWRNKLDELEHLPGSSFRGDAAWDKLYGRLQGNKKSKKIFWYWIAAACILFGLMITLLNYRKDNSVPAKQETAMKQQPKEIKKSSLKVEDVDKSVNENSGKLIKNKTLATSNRPDQKNRRVVKTDVATKLSHDDIIIHDPEQEPIVKPLQITNVNSTATLVPQKKKLNVVHINELGDPAVETLDMTSKIGSHSFKLASGEVANPSTVYKNTDFTILKTKL